MLRKISPYWMYGTRPIAAALANPNRTCLPLLSTEQARETLATLLQRYPPSHIAQRRLAQATLVSRQAIDKLHKVHTTHQSLSLKCQPLPPPPLPRLLDTLLLEKTTTLLMLDQVQDPHNIGAILRSARFFDAQALLLAKGHAPQENASIAKAACGALEHVPILHANLAQTLTMLEKKGWSRIAFEARQQESHESHESPESHKSQESHSCENNILAAEHKVLVFGAEGKGLRRLVREHCDLVAHIEGGKDDAENLNVSNAVAVALALARERQKDDKKKC